MRQGTLLLCSHSSKSDSPLPSFFSFSWGAVLTAIALGTSPWLSSRNFLANRFTCARHAFASMLRSVRGEGSLDVASPRGIVGNGPQTLGLVLCFSYET